MTQKPPSRGCWVPVMHTSFQQSSLSDPHGRGMLRLVTSCSCHPLVLRDRICKTHAAMLHCGGCNPACFAPQVLFHGSCYTNIVACSTIVVARNLYLCGNIAACMQHYRILGIKVQCLHALPPEFSSSFACQVDPALFICPCAGANLMGLSL